MRQGAVGAVRLVVRGEHSQMLPAEVASRMVARPETELLTVAGCGHRPWFWTPEQIAPIAAWLGRQAA